MNPNCRLTKLRNCTSIVSGAVDLDSRSDDRHQFIILTVDIILYTARTVGVRQRETKNSVTVCELESRWWRWSKL